MAGFSAKERPKQTHTHERSTARRMHIQFLLFEMIHNNVNIEINHDSVVRYASLMVNREAPTAGNVYTESAFLFHECHSTHRNGPIQTTYYYTLELPLTLFKMCARTSIGTLTSDVILVLSVFFSSLLRLIHGCWAQYCEIMCLGWRKIWCENLLPAH